MSVGVSRNNAEYAHYLLLINDTSVGRAKYRLKKRMRVAYLRRVVPCLYILRDRVHRSRSVKCNGGDNVLKSVGSKLAEHLSHSARLKLKYTLSVSVRDELVGRRIVKRDRVNIKIRLSFAHRLACVVYYGEIPERKEVELEKSKLCYGIHIKLRYYRTVARGKRQIFGYRLVADYYSRRVYGDISRHTLKRERRVDKPLYLC